MNESMEIGQQNAGGDRRTDHARDVRTHCVHQKEISGVFFLTDFLAHARRHRDCGNACRTDQRIDLSACEFAHEFRRQKSAERGDREGDQSQHNDQDRLQFQEVIRACRCSDRDAEEHRYDIHQFVLHRFGEPFGHAANVEQISEHQTSDLRTLNG